MARKNSNHDLIINSAGDANNPSLRINNASSNTFNHSIESFNSNLTSGETELILVGKEGSTKNSGYIGYYWSAAGSDNNYITLGHWSNNHLLRVYGNGLITAATNTMWHAGNDGSGSTLDADLLDGQQGTYYRGGAGLGQNISYVASSTSTSNRGNHGAGVWAYSGYSTGSNRPYTYDATLQVMPTGALGFELSTSWHSTGEGTLKIRALRDCCEGWGSYYDIWSSANDGSGSGLDADTVDGQHLGTSAAVAFDHLNLGGATGDNGEDLKVGGIRGRFTNEHIQLYNKVGIGYPSGWDGDNSATPTGGLAVYGGTALAYNNGGVSIGQSYSSGDHSNTSLEVNGDASLRAGSWLYFGQTTTLNSWKTRIGSANTSTMNINAQGLDVNNAGYASPAVTWLKANNTELSHKNNTIWHAGNDGSGTGLDADTLDSYQASAFPRKAEDAAITGNYDFSGTGLILSSHFYTRRYDANGNVYFHVGTADNVANILNLRVYDASNGVKTLVLNGGTGAISWNGSTIWHAGNDGSLSGLDADTLDGLHLSNIDNAEGYKTWAVSASGAQTVRHHIARLYATPAHWDANWQNIELQITAEYFEATTLKFRLQGNYGSGEANMMRLHLLDAAGDLVNNIRLVLGSATDAGWDYSNQNVYYMDLYADVRYYSQFKIHAKTFGHGYGTTNPTSGGYHTIFYASPSTSNISDFSINHIDPIFRGYKIWHAANDGSGSTLDADTVDGIQGASLLRSDADDSYAGNLTVNGMTFKSNSNVSRNFKIQPSSSTTDVGISAFRGDGVHSFQLYGTNNQYGFLDSNWGGWDIRKTKDGALHIDEGSGLNQVLSLGSDGAGSGLDADTVDGVQASAIIHGNNTSGTNELLITDWNNVDKSGFYSDDNASNSWTTGWTSIINHRLYDNDNNYHSQIGFGTYTAEMYFRGKHGASAGWSSWYEVWHSGVDGSGSGLDADTLDGIQGASFLRSDEADSAQGAAMYVFNKPTPSGYQTALRVGTEGGGLFLTSNNAIIGKGAYYNNGWIATAANGCAIDFASNEPLIFSHSGATAGNSVTMSASTKIWHAGNDGSGSGLDADTLDALNVHNTQSTQNSANTILRTQVNGYTMLGWINTTSGDMTSTLQDRIYCSNDGYIRYVDLASFRARMNVTAKTGYQGRESSTTDTSYWVGAMGWGTTDFNDIFHYGSGTIDSWSSPGNQPSTATSHWVGSQHLHYTNGTNAYGHQILVGAGSPSLMYVRGRWGTSFTSWSQMWNSSNDGAGSGLDADTLDGMQPKSASGQTGSEQVLRSASNGYFYHKNWTDVAGAGLFSTTTNGAHFYPNAVTSHGAWRMNGTRGGYNGIVFDTSSVYITLMANGTTMGFYNASDGEWMMYANRNSGCYLFFDNSQKLETVTGGVNVTGTMTASADVVAYSDERLKSNIETLDGSKVYEMRGVSFTKDEKDGSGVIAQELEKVAPELVNNDNEFKSVAYGNITGYLIEAIKDLKQEIEELKKQIK